MTDTETPSVLSTNVSTTPLVAQSGDTTSLLSAPSDNAASIDSAQSGRAGPPPQPDPVDGPTPAVSTLSLSFLDFSCAPIEGLKYRVKGTDGRILLSGTTDATGLTERVDGLEPGLAVNVQVWRDSNSSYKDIGQIVLASGNQCLTCVSPKIKLTAETQPIAGSPGTGDEEAPPAPPALGSASPALTAANAGVGSPPPPVPSAPSAPQPVPEPSGAPGPASGVRYTVISGDTLSRIAQRRGTSVAQLEAMNPQLSDPNSLQIGETLNVPPSNAATTGLVTPTPPIPAASSATSSPTSASTSRERNVAYGRDRHSLPMAVVVSQAEDWIERKVLAAYNFWTHFHFTGEKSPTAGHEQINPSAAGPSSASSSNSSGSTAASSSLTHLQTLVALHEQQALTHYPPHTVQVISAYAQGNPPTWPSKPAEQSLGQCLEYVKVSLFRAGYVNGIPGTNYAKDSGSDWLHFGFSNVTSSLPKVKVVMLDGVEAYQVDLIYALPGDVVVYEKYGQSNAPGHVDIRTYHGFGSDFFWPARGGFPDQSHYRVIGVYRKFSDNDSQKRLRAFLRILREYETKGYQDPYHALFDPSGITKPTFSDETHHPYREAAPDRPAGAYQIKWGTFKESVLAMHWGGHASAAPYEVDAPFDPPMQDRVAIYRLQYRHASGQAYPRRSALGYVLEGKIERAVLDCQLFHEWACLPGGGSQSQITMPQLLSKFNEYLNE